ncbi:phage major capsid protein [Kribbella sp. NPDC051718]|uniref:phage major capsid protein n=1 Tax=Kribbella sp. NPDC051718 TaxID=3155168 RepID=UPI003445F27C
MADKPDTMSTKLEELRGKSVTDLTEGETPEVLRGLTPDELDQFIEVLDAHLRSIHQSDEGELRDLTSAEQSAFDYGMVVREHAIKKLEEHRAIADVFRRRPKAVEVAMTRSWGNSDDPFGDVRRLNTKEARDRALRKLDDRDATGHMSDAEKVQVERTIRRDTDIARRILVTENEHYREAWMKLVTRTHPFLSQEEQRAMEAYEEYRAMSEGTTTAGGFGVPVFIDPSIILTAQESGNPFLQLCTQKTVTTNRWKGVSSAGVSWSFDAEGSQVSDDSPTLAQPVVDVEMARGFIPYSIEVGMDYPAFADEMSTLLGAGYDELLVQKFSVGAGHGSLEPMGLLTALDANTNVEVAVTTDGAFGAVDVYKVWKSLPQKYRRKASWMMSVDVNNQIRQLGTANNFHASTVDLKAEAADVLMTKQVYESPYFPDFALSTTTTSNLLVVGDFSNYVIARQGGMSVEYIPQLFQQTTAGTGFGRPTGQRGWFGYARIGGNSVNDLAFRLLQA